MIQGPSSRMSTPTGTGNPQKTAESDARRSRAAGSVVSSAEGATPRTVIRGESTSVKGAIVDYLRFTFLPDTNISDSLTQLQKYMRLWFPVPVNFAPSSRGIFGYESSYDVNVWANGEIIRVAIIAMGGHSAGNTMCVDMSGMGCSLVEDWEAVYSTLQDLDGRITRADVAVDLFQGFTVEQFDEMYFAGDFNAGGRIPSRKMIEAGDSNKPVSYTHLTLPTKA